MLAASAGDDGPSFARLFPNRTTRVRMAHAILDRGLIEATRKATNHDKDHKNFDRMRARRRYQRHIRRHRTHGVRDGSPSTPPDQLGVEHWAGVERRSASRA